jgi:SNARE protein 1
MATQLKHNAQHFSNSLANDKLVIEETHEKLEGNFGTMVKEKMRLRDFSVKSRGSTWLVVMIVVVVLAVFVMMVGVVRFSRR